MSLLLLLIDACLAENQQKTNFIVHFCITGAGTHDLS